MKQIILLITLFFNFQVFATYNSVTGVVFRDENINGSLDLIDQRQSAITIQVFTDENLDGIVNGSDAFVESDITIANGSYKIDSILPGDYLIKVLQSDFPSNATFTTQQSFSFSFAGGGEELTYNFGYSGPGIGCFAFAATGDRLHVFNRYSSTNRVIGSQSTAANLQAMALTPNGNVLWGVNNTSSNDRLGRINKQTGQFSPRPNPFGTANGSKGAVFLDSVFGISFQPSTGILYGIASTSGTNVLFKIDTITGNHLSNGFGTGIGYLEIEEVNGDKENDDMAFNPINGLLYALEQDAGSGGNGTFTTINLNTGNVTIVGSTNVDNIEGLTFTDDGLFLGTTGVAGGSNAKSWFEINESNGNTTYIATFSGNDNDYESCACPQPSIPEPPLAVDDLTSTPEEVAVNIDVQSNDITPAGNTLITTIIDMPNNGTAVILNTDSILYTPNTGFTGNDTLIYQICTDNTGICDDAIVIINVYPSTSIPNAQNDFAFTDINQAVTIDVQNNDSDPENDVLTTSIVSNPSSGTVTVVNGDSIIYTPNNNFSGYDTFLYSICDPSGNCDTALVTVLVLTENEPIEASDDYDTTYQNIPKVVDVQFNDTTSGSNLTLSTISIPDAPNNGIAIIINLDSVLYTPNLDYVGTDNFQYQVCDGSGNCSNAYVYITVLPNLPPIAIDDYASGNSEIEIEINVLSNDSDPDNDPFTITSFTQPTNGTVYLNDGQYYYTSNDNFVGNDQFVYEICDDKGGCDTANVFIDVIENDGIPVLPTGFTPNGDGVNDFFVVENVKLNSTIDFVVVNRWGNVVYEDENYENNWNGSNNSGEELPDGTYFVVVRVDNEDAYSSYVDLRRK